MEITAAIVSPT